MISVREYHDTEGRIWVWVIQYEQDIEIGNVHILQGSVEHKRLIKQLQSSLEDHETNRRD